MSSSSRAEASACLIASRESCTVTSAKSSPILSVWCNTLYPFRGQ